MRRQEFAAAVPLLEKCVAADQGNSKFHQWLGRALGLQAAQNGIASSLFSIRKVKAELEKAIELDALNLEARQDLAILYRALPGLLGGSNARAAEQVAFIRQERSGWRPISSFRIRSIGPMAARCCCRRANSP